MTQPGVVEQNGGQETADPLFDWLFVMGYPISDPVWVQVKLQGSLQWVLVQPFERRVLDLHTVESGWLAGRDGKHRPALVTDGAMPRHRSVTVSPAIKSFLAMITRLPMDLRNIRTESVQVWQITGVVRSSFIGRLVELVMRAGGSSGDTSQVAFWGVTQSGLDLLWLRRTTTRVGSWRIRPKSTCRRFTICQTIIRTSVSPGRPRRPPS